MESCYEYLGCNRSDSVVFGRKDNAPCWTVEGTLCNNQGIQLIRDKHGGKKEESCARAACIYYKSMKNRSS